MLLVYAHSKIRFHRFLSYWDYSHQQPLNFLAKSGVSIDYFSFTDQFLAVLRFWWSLESFRLHATLKIARTHLLACRTAHNQQEFAGIAVFQSYVCAVASSWVSEDGQSDSEYFLEYESYWARKVHPHRLQSDATHSYALQLQAAVKSYRS
jgi:hypothetical protein